ncbi:MAG TPA: HU family DNA-binding protein [Candidatus Acidoferrum sp.]|nr:HU family DNA-binding protein [Candidatus Acidoferrum sp.]
MAARVQQALSLPTKKQAEMIADTVITALEATLLNNLGTDGFTLKLGSFGKFSVRHKPGILRKIPFTGETILTKDRRKVRFVSLGRLRQREQVV